MSAPIKYRHLLKCGLCGGISSIVVYNEKENAGRNWAGTPYLCLKCHKASYVTHDDVIPIYKQYTLFEREQEQK